MLSRRARRPWLSPTGDFFLSRMKSRGWSPAKWLAGLHDVAAAATIEARFDRPTRARRSAARSHCWLRVRSFLFSRWLRAWCDDAGEHVLCVGDALQVRRAGAAVVIELGVDEVGGVFE